MLTLREALRACEQLASVATLLSALELLRVRATFAEHGVYRWSVLRRDWCQAPWLVRRALDAALSYRGFVALLSMQASAALVLAWRECAPLVPLLACLQLLVSLRFSGPYNGGSDAMLTTVWLGLTLARACPLRVLELAGLGYIAAQLVLSYVVAGVVKLREPGWRDGRTLRALLALPAYDAPRWSVRVFTRPALARLASIAVIAFECAFLFALFDARLALVLLCAALAFHVVNAYVLGLNRFVWAWLAAYPALVYFSQRG